MNHERNEAWSNEKPNARLGMPVLFVHAAYDYVCETMTSSLAEPMRGLCDQLTEKTIPSGHWMAQERPQALNMILDHWLREIG